MDLRIDRLTASDIGDAHSLSTTVGWNQTREDWQRLRELFPDACFAGHVGDELVATSTLASYGDRVGWIGMVLVDPDYRRRGYGSAVFERALDFGLDAGLDTIGLDATDAGRRVYDDYGFERTIGIDRWSGELELPEGWSHEDSTRVSDVETLIGYDSAHIGVDRRGLLSHLLDSKGVTAIRVPADSRPKGFAFVRPGRERPQIGPIVCEDPESLKRLLAAIDHRVEGEIILDVLDRDRITEVLSTAGLAVDRSLHRMTNDGTASPLEGADVVAATGFEWG